MEEKKAWAKLNLTLDILRKRPDGYHDMCMIMQSISLCDTLTFADSEKMTLHTDLPYLPNNRNNIVWKAADAFFRESGVAPQGLDVALYKEIPVCAGMAGGSSDGAAALRYLRDRFAVDMPQTELERIGAMVGSDVPFCLRGGTVLAEGRGEVLTDLPVMPPCTFLICKPPFPISTPELFARVRSIRIHPDTAGAIRALERGDLEGLTHRMYNVFEDMLPKKYSAVIEIKHRMLELGAMGACMTGSGPTVFGVFADAAPAEEAAEALRQSYTCVHIARPVDGK